MSKYIISAFADEYADSFDSQLKMLCEQGISHTELRFIDGKNIADIDVKELVGRLDGSGIQVSAIGSPLGKIGINGDIDGHIEKAKRVCENAAILGTEFVRVFSFYVNDREAEFSKVVDSMGRMLDIADEFGVTLCHENEAKIYGESPKDCLSLLKVFNGKLRCVFDMGNFVLGGYRPFPDAYSMLKPYIEYFHIKDALYAGAIVPPGKGEACIKQILSEHGRGVFVTLEPHLQTFSGLNALTNSKFDNPYKFNSKEEAFLTALEDLRRILSVIA